MSHHAVRDGQRHATRDPRRVWPRIAIAMLSAVFATTIGACGDSTGMSDDSYDIAFDVTNLFDENYDQSYGLPREGRAAVLTLRARLK